MKSNYYYDWLRLNIQNILTVINTIACVFNQVLNFSESQLLHLSNGSNNKSDIMLISLECCDGHIRNIYIFQHIVQYKDDFGKNIFYNQQLKQKKYLFHMKGRGFKINGGIFLFYYLPELVLAADSAWSNCSDQWSMAKDKRNETFN